MKKWIGRYLWTRKWANFLWQRQVKILRLSTKSSDEEVYEFIWEALGEDLGGASNCL